MCTVIGGDIFCVASLVPRTIRWVRAACLMIIHNLHSISWTAPSVFLLRWVCDGQEPSPPCWRSVDGGFNRGPLPGFLCGWSRKRRTWKSKVRLGSKSSPIVETRWEHDHMRLILMATNNDWTCTLVCNRAISYGRSPASHRVLSNAQLGPMMIFRCET